ncbi:energy transducer TonB [bacterium]|nr:energy transducer TonB [bacterium]
MKDNHLLLKTFFLSLAIHITGISLFSIVFPTYLPKRKPIEVSLLPPSMDKKVIKLAKAEIFPELPEIKTTYEKLAVVNEKEIMKFSLKEFLGSPEYIPLTQITKNFEIPQFKIKFPQLKRLSKEEKAIKKEKTERIEGPAGTRKLIYREKIKYPDWAEKEGIEGVIKIKFWVEPDGKISETEIINSSGFPDLDIYTVENFRKWLFEPVKTDKRVWGIITFIFQLK